MITLNTSQLPTPAQGVQTISINGVQVQGVPVTITNAGGKSMSEHVFHPFFLTYLLHHDSHTVSA